MTKNFGVENNVIKITGGKSRITACYFCRIGQGSTIYVQNRQKM
jgi:hypothetical protein